MASMNWPWNSAAIRRIRPIVWPTVRITRGRSFGGITAKATMATMIILLMSRSNMAHRTGSSGVNTPAFLSADFPVEGVQLTL